MKEIKAVIGPHKLPALHAAMRGAPGFAGMTVSKAEGYLPPEPRARPSIRQELTDHVARLRVEMVVSDEAAPGLYEAVLACLSSGAAGDSMVWMTDVERAAFVHKTV
ncbi:MAG: nitrogen regulatory protein 1 [Pseudomonadota bacterium]|jgi:nitrogen regulatory protein P-II 1